MPRRVSPSCTVWFEGVGLGSGIGLGMVVPVFPATAGVRTGVPVGKVVLVGSKVSAAVGTGGGLVHPAAMLAATKAHKNELVRGNLAGGIALLNYRSRLGFGDYRSGWALQFGSLAVNRQRVCRCYLCIGTVEFSGYHLGNSRTVLFVTYLFLTI